MPLLLVVAFAIACLGTAPLAIAENMPQRLGLCAACHGERGVATGKGIPNLAGQNIDYLRIALNQYRSGARDVPAHARSSRHAQRGRARPGPAVVCTAATGRDPHPVSILGKLIGGLLGFMLFVTRSASSSASPSVTCGIPARRACTLLRRHPVPSSPLCSVSSAPLQNPTAASQNRKSPPSRT